MVLEILSNGIAICKKSYVGLRVVAALQNLDFSVVSKLFGIDKFDNFHLDVISKFLERKDIFLSLRTGGVGGSFCYQSFLMMWKLYHDECCQLLVITRLISVMKEQFDFLSKCGFQSRYIVLILVTYIPNLHHWFHCLTLSHTGPAVQVF